jgi:hypothetical protein
MNGGADLRGLMGMALACAALSAPVTAREAPASAPAPDEVSELRAQMLEKMRAIDEQQRQLLQKMEEVEQQRRELELMVNRVEALDAYRGGADTSGQPQSEVASERKAERQAEAEKVPELPRISPEVGGVLTPKGRLVLEPNVQYVYTSVNRISVDGYFVPGVLIGAIDVVEVDRDAILASLAARYGVTNRLELELKTPYVYRHDSTRTRTVVGPDEQPVSRVVSADASGLGDIEFDIRYHLPRPSPAWPHMVANVRTKAPTGTDPFDFVESDNNLPSKLATGSGFWTFNPSVTFIYPTDPVVFFGNLGYLYTLEDYKGGEEIGDVDPGDAVRMNFGMGLGLNERSSFSISYSLDLYNRTEIEFRDAVTEFLHRQKIDGSDVTVGKLLIGYSLRTPGGMPLSLSVGIGATDDAPDTDLTFRIPVTIFD